MTITSFLRSQCVKQFLHYTIENSKCKKWNAENKSNIVKYVNQLEVLIYQMSQNNLLTYRAHCTRMTFNLYKNAKFLMAKYSPSVLLILTDSLLAENTDMFFMQKAYHERSAYFNHLLDANSLNLLKDEDNLKPFITCRKCRGDKVITESKQTRSADEGMTIFCMCQECGCRWKM